MLSLEAYKCNRIDAIDSENFNIIGLYVHTIIYSIFYYRFQLGTIEKVNFAVFPNRYDIFMFKKRAHTFLEAWQCIRTLSGVVAVITYHVPLPRLPSYIIISFF